MKGERKEEWKRGMEGKRKLKREMKKENDLNTLNYRSPSDPYIQIRTYNTTERSRW